MDNRVDALVATHGVDALQALEPAVDALGPRVMLA